MLGAPGLPVDSQRVITCADVPAAVPLSFPNARARPVAVAGGLSGVAGRDGDEAEAVQGGRFSVAVGVAASSPTARYRRRAVWCG